MRPLINVGITRVVTQYTSRLICIDLCVSDRVLPFYFYGVYREYRVVWVFPKKPSVRPPLPGHRYSDTGNSSLFVLGPVPMSYPFHSILVYPP